MTTISIIIWLLLGIIAVWREYYGSIKEWYILFDEDKRISKYNQSLKVLILLSPIFILGGLITLFLFEYRSYYNTWYFKIPK